MVHLLTFHVQIAYLLLADELVPCIEVDKLSILSPWVFLFLEMVFATTRLRKSTSLCDKKIETNGMLLTA